MQISSYLQETLLRHLFTGVPYTAPSTVYLGLCTANPTPENIAASEVQNDSNGDVNYLRQALSLVSPQGKQIALPPGVYQPASSNNTNSVSFAEPSIQATLYYVPYMAIYDALTGGNLMFFSKLPFLFERTDGGSTLDFPIGNIKVYFI